MDGIARPGRGPKEGIGFRCWSCLPATYARARFLDMSWRGADQARPLGFAVIFLLGCSGDPAVPQPIAGGPGAAAGPAVHARASAVYHYSANYGAWTPTDLAIAKRQQPVIAIPGPASFDRTSVKEIQAGVDP